jgi:hypothetical protein
MGILDDAIREHLELKRRHGAAEEELQRQEEEALGPARRDVAPAPAEEAEAEAAEALPDDVHAAETQLNDAEPAEAPPEVESELAQAASLEAADEASAMEPAEREAWPETTATEGTVGQPTQAFDAQSDEGWDEPEPEAPAPAAGESVLEPKADHPTADPVLDPEPPARSGDTPPRGFESPPEDKEPFVEEPARDEDLFADDEPFADEPREAAEEPPAEGEDVLEDTPDFLQETPEHDRLWFEQKPPRDFDFD